MPPQDQCQSQRGQQENRDQVAPLEMEEAERVRGPPGEPQELNGGHRGQPHRQPVAGQVQRRPGAQTGLRHHFPERLRVQRPAGQGRQRREQRGQEEQAGQAEPQQLFVEVRWNAELGLRHGVVRPGHDGLLRPGVERQPGVGHQELFPAGGVARQAVHPVGRPAQGREVEPRGDEQRVGRPLGIYMALDP